MAPTKPTARSSSRFSSPLHLSNPPAGHNKGMTSDGQRNFMARWLEPPVQSKPSFQEAGLMRGGVVENMAPLGTLPRAAMHKRSQPAGDETPAPSVKRIVLKKTPKAAPTEDGDVHQAAAGRGDVVEVEVADGFADAAETTATTTSPTRPLFPVTGLDDSEDDDYRPNNPIKAKARRTSANNGLAKRPPGRPRKNTTTARAKSPAPAAAPPPPPPAMPHSDSPSSPAPSPVPAPVNFVAPLSLQDKEPDNKPLADLAVEYAVEEALQHHRYPTAWALRLLYDDNSKDNRFVAMIEDIYLQRADVDTQREFSRLVREKKKEGKRDNTACDYFVPPSPGNSRSTPNKPKPAPYGALLTMDFSAAKTPSKPPPKASTLSPVKLSKHTSEDGDGHVSKKARLEASSAPASMGLGLANGGRGRPKGINGSAPAKHSPSKHSPSKHSSSKHHSPTKSLTKSPSKGRRGRTGSVSSDSSLSEVPDDEPEDYDEFKKMLDDEISRPSTAEPNHAPKSGDVDQPISSPQQKPTSKKTPRPDAVSPNASGTQSSAHPHDSDMSAAAVITNGTSQQRPPFTHANTPLRFASKYAEALNQDPLIQRKLQAKAGTAGLTRVESFASFTREPLAADSIEEALPVLPPVAEPTRSLRTPVALTGRAARAAKRNHEDAESSPVATEIEPPSTRSSRAATPSGNLRSTKKPKTSGLRVKNSPMKKKGSTAGVPREGNGLMSNEKENGASNDDACWTCGGNGELVCCDGCHYSFHFLCIDPPLNEDQLPQDWYCYECLNLYFPAHFVGNKGTFGSLLDNLDKSNPRAFRLPHEIRDFFEGVRTGEEGEYQDIPTGKPPKGKKGYEEPFDFYKIRDADGNAVLCHQCHQGAGDNRAIIPCSVPNCGLQFHLECLDPPMTIPPVVRTWQCPCHAGRPPILKLAPAHRYRKIKNAPIIEQAYGRGLRNNGFIEVEEDDDEAEDAFVTRNDYGRVYRLPEKGIKLDFIASVLKKRKPTTGNSPSPVTAPPAAPPSAPSVAPVPPTLEEQQAALNLSQLARGDGVSQLIQALISQASPDAVALMAQGDATRLASGDLNQANTTALQAMLTQADGLRNSIKKLLEARQPNQEQASDRGNAGDSMHLD